MKLLTITVTCVLLSACAGSAPTATQFTDKNSNLPSFTASYKAFSCDQLYSEARRINGQMHDTAEVRDADMKNEELEFLGGVLYWPVLLFVDGSSDSAAADAEYEQLQARLLSLSEWVEQKGCATWGYGKVD